MVLEALQTGGGVTEISGVKGWRGGGRGRGRRGGGGERGGGAENPSANTNGRTSNQPREVLMHKITTRNKHTGLDRQTDR